MSSNDGQDLAIGVRNVSKSYVLFERPEDRFKQMLVPRLQRLAGQEPTRYYREFSALRDVSFDISRGETVGIIGKNGSGKSSLLQIICGTLAPTSGTVHVNGRIAALLELGAGFNPEFSGRENVFLNAAILGVPRDEMEWRFDDIARFADIGDFIDQPVKTYSSGMYVRLAFATAVNVDPDILVVDEALSVGDEAFQRKCFARIEEIKDRGGTILFVSHGAQTIVQLCTRAILIDQGEILLEGRPKSVVGQYQRLVNLTGPAAQAAREDVRRTRSISSLSSSSEDTAGAVEISEPVAFDDAELESFDPSFVSQTRVVYESEGATIENLRLLNSRGQPVTTLQAGREYAYCYDVRFDREARDVGFGMLVKTLSGVEIGGAGSGQVTTYRLRSVDANTSYAITFRFVCTLLPGAYLMNAGVTGTADEGARFLHRILDAFIFRVAPQPETIATGLVDIGAVPTVTKLEPPTS